MRNKYFYRIILAVFIFCLFTVGAFANNLGDIDGDSNINSADARLALRAAVGLESLTSEEKIAADADHDEIITAADARIILRVSVNLQEFQHKFDDPSAKIKILTPASCEEDGLMEIVCVCGAVTQRKIEKTGHNFSNPSVSVEPGCETDGITTYTCELCGKTRDEIIPALGHDLDGVQWTDVKLPSCTENGKQCAICRRCSKKIYRDVKPLGHDFSGEYVVDKKAGCTQAGVKSKRCLRCGASGEETEIPPLGHSFAEGIIAVAPTCQKTGKMRYNCRSCAYFYTEQIPALGHDYNATVYPPSCTEDGYTLYRCKRCGHSYKDNFVKASRHNWVEQKEKNIAPDCVNIGKRFYLCSVCGEEKCEDVPALGHDFRLDSLRCVEPSCVSAGLEAYTCARCSKTNDKILPPLKHTYAPLEGKEPTCTEAGLSEGKKCSVCGAVIIGQQVIPPKGHSFGEWITDYEPSSDGSPGKQHRICSACGYTEYAEYTCPHQYNVSYDAATCETPGKTIYTCRLCGFSYEVVAEPPLGHDYIETVVKPTCTEEGYTLHKCSRCLNEYKDSYTLPTGHAEEKRNGVDPTCESPGKTPDIYCRICGKKLKEGQPLRELGHIEPDFFTVVEEPTCTKEGIERKICARKGCGKVFEERTIPKIPHKPRDEYEYSEDGAERVKKCAYCGEIIIREKAAAAFINSDGSVREYIFEFEDAVNSAEAGDMIRVAPDYELKRDITVNKGVMLLLPCLDGDAGYDERGYNPDGTASVVPYEDSKTLYAAFTVPRGIKIDVYGTLLINAVTGRNISGSNTTYDVSGGYAEMRLDGNVFVKSGGIFDCAGFVDGKGKVTLEDGALMYETYALVKWRGGTQALYVYLSSQYPALESMMNNMKAELVINSGATLSGTVKACATQKGVPQAFAERFVLFDKDRGIFRLHEGGYCIRNVVYVKELSCKFYDYEGLGGLRDIYKFYGGADFLASELTIAGLKLATDDFPYYIFDGDLSFEFYDGEYNIKRGFRFLPGFTMKAGKGSEVNILNNGNPSGQKKLGGLVFHSEEYAVLDQAYAAEDARYPLGRGDAYFELMPEAKLNVEKGAALAGKVIKHEGAQLNIDEEAVKEVAVFVFQGKYNDPKKAELKTVFTLEDAGA